MKRLEAFDEVKRLIVVAAHPDDMETMCGGAVALLAQRGAKVFSVNCTLGDIGARGGTLTRPALAVTRLDETEEAARILGVEETFNLGRPDGELVADLDLRAQIAALGTNLLTVTPSGGFGGGDGTLPPEAVAEKILHIYEKALKRR